MFLTVVFGALAALSLALMVWQVLVAARFPLHHRSARTGFCPAITLLKPLKGCDAETRGCLSSWLTQQYGGRLQVIFGVAAAEDPVCALVRELIREHPDCAAELVICGGQPGLNAKVSQLIQLEGLAAHELICVSDADVWAPPDYLANAVLPLRDPEVGLVNSFYRLTGAGRFGMRWEAFAVNADFWSQVLQSVCLKPMDFALGAVMLVGRRRVQAIGGFGALADYLADDYQLGHRIWRNGGRIVLSPLVVECRSAPMTFGEVWLHQLRWARTIRACQPGLFFSSVLGNASLWPALWLAVTPCLAAWAGLGLCLAFRMFAGAWLERRLTGRWSAVSCGMALVKDGFQVAIWALAFAGSEIVWRGLTYRVASGGRLVTLGVESGR